VALLPKIVLHFTVKIFLIFIFFFILEFVGSLEDLFDENILIGPGWTAHESLRFF